MKKIPFEKKVRLKERIIFYLMPYLPASVLLQAILPEGESSLNRPKVSRNYQKGCSFVFDQRRISEIAKVYELG